MNEATERAISVTTLDDFHFRLKCGIDMLDVVRAGIKSDIYSGEIIDNALYGVVLYLMGMRDELGQMVEQAVKGKG